MKLRKKDWKPAGRRGSLRPIWIGAAAGLVISFVLITVLAYLVNQEMIEMKLIKTVGFAVLPIAGLVGCFLTQKLDGGKTAWKSVVTALLLWAMFSVSAIAQHRAGKGLPITFGLCAASWLLAWLTARRNGRGVI